MRLNVESLLSELVALDSVSNRSNSDIISYLEQKVTALGFATQRLSYADPFGVEKINLLATSDPNADIVELGFVGHTDTVPYAKDWTDALKLTPGEGVLIGRGACDTKGFIAAALTAASNYKIRNLRRPFAMVFTADEEVGCLGAKAIADARFFKIRNAVVGEPTLLRPMRAGKGYCLAEVVVTGREGHSAYPDVGASAIQAAARIVVQIEDLARQLRSDSRPEFDPPFTTINIGIIEGGTAKNIIPGRCRFTLEWRPIPGQKPELVMDRIREFVIAEMRDRPGIKVSLDVLRVDGGMETPADSRLVRFMEQVTGQTAGTIAFGTEAPQMIELGADAVVLGPGDIQVAHRTGEYVPVEHLHRLVDILSRTISEFCL